MDVIHEIISDNVTEHEPVQVDNKLAFVNDWFLMGSPIPISLILVAYLLFVLKIGPELMKDRKPFQLNNILIFYNIVQVAISCGLLNMCFGMIANHGLLPQTCVMETDAQRLMLTSATYNYFSAKVTELLDTVFFVLRKKDNQITFLHVYHHTLMVFVTWTALKFEPNYGTVFLGTVNSFVHVLMYTYYGLSSFPSLAKYLWWKKYITTLQLIQFVSILIHFYIYYATSDCTPSTIMSVTMACNIFLFLFMFGKFYLNTYIENNKEKANNVYTRAKLNEGKGYSDNTNGGFNEAFKGNGKNTIETAYVNGYTAVQRKYNSVGN